MTKSQQRAAIEEEDETAAYNTGRYQSKHGWRGAGIGAGVGAIGGRALVGRGHGITGALTGAALGGAIGIIRGTDKQEKMDTIEIEDPLDLLENLMKKMPNEE